MRKTRFYPKPSLSMALVLGLAAASPAFTQTAPAATASAAPGYVLPETETWELQGPGGYPYQIFVSKPEGKAPDGGWPVLYVLDGNAMFAGFAETRRIQSMDDRSEVAKSIIVGIGYKTDKPYDEHRLFDFTSGPAPQPWRVAFSKVPAGGWELFLDFLTGKLRAEVNRRYGINPDRQALFGHSLGGLFAVHTLFTRPDAFHAIIAASPSLFWHDQEMQKEEHDFVARLQSGKIPQVSRLMVVCGELEETSLERDDAVAFAKRMELLSGYGLRTKSEVYMGEGHITVPSRSVTSTLRYAFAWP
ncbi:alpha/beta hydrolase [Sphingomonas oryzagri]|uniref:Alpha/beta hydrolase-fold protein n=1 Tax=Sphingomonas oryzagri TaxID=3042314 RepID=A0ABT6MXB8_9SPHN|nr:alpha/beta hydrolase-fold protein [Sphingomonas oryzagri]MDH7637695.1 alpha/beta hydrolase-fold protein [Sphingomonas oryzagri]